MSKRRISIEDWRAEGEARYGKDKLKWRFKCPSCGYVQSVEDYRDAGAPEGHVAFSCIGRSLPDRQEMGTKEGGPCNYAGGGLIRLNPVVVVTPDGEQETFEWAD